MMISSDVVRRESNDVRGDSPEKATAENDDESAESERRRRRQPPRPIVFLDIDGVLNTTKHSMQIHVEECLVARLGSIVHKTDALIVLTTFWRHFFDYIVYVLHRHGIDVGRHVLPSPMGTTDGKQCTKTFLRFHRMRTTREEEGRGEEGGGDGGHVRRLGCATTDENYDGCMIGRSAEDEREYSSRADEIEAWLVRYGNRYLGNSGNSNDEPGDDDGSKTDDGFVSNYQGYVFHPADWRYVILDDRPSAAKPNTPLMDRFVHTDTRMGLTEADADRAVKLLLFGPYSE